MSFPKDSSSSPDPRLRNVIRKLDEGSQGGDKSKAEQINQKIIQAVDEFAEGAMNQQQFLDIYRHYRNEKYALKARVNVGDTSGHTMMIRNRHKTNTLAYAIYNSDSGIPLGTRGDFPIDPALLIPMLASYHNVAKEIFGQGIRKAEVVGGKWMSFIVGKITTMITIVENEPSESYMTTMTKQHALFEQRNAEVLAKDPIVAAEIEFPKPLFLQMMGEVN